MAHAHDSRQTTEADRALIQAVLYIATADVDCRRAAKTYWQEHKEEDSTLARLMPLVTRINRKFFNRHNIEQESKP